MTIYIAPGWLLIANMILPLPIFLLTRKFLVSDYFYNKTGRKLYYIKKDGSREFIDSMTIISVLLMYYWIFGFTSYLISYLLEDYFFFHIGLVLCGLFTYCDIIIFLRIKFFYYEGDKYASEKRLLGTYPMYSMIWTFWISLFGTFILVMYFIFHKTSIIYGLILLLITMHVFLFPDYMNKVLPWDVRTDKGHFVESVIIIQIVFYIVLFLTFFY